MATSRFVPNLSYIIDISNEQNAVLRFSTNHDFTDGEYISLRVSAPYGMVEMNNRQARVLSHTSNTVTVGIDTQQFTPFVYPPVDTVVVPAVAVPAGSGIIPDSNPATVNLQDAFDNIRT